MESTHEEGGSTAGIGRAVTIVDASIEDCAAWELARVSRERMKDHYKWGGLGKSLLKLNNHSDLFYNVIDFGVKTLAPREWVSKVVWKMVDKDTMLVCYEDVEDDRFPPSAGKGYVRASSGAFWKYELLPEVRGIPQTRVTYCQQIDLKGFIAALVMNSRSVQTLEYLSSMRQKFDKSMEIDAGHRSAIVQLIELKEESGGAETLAQFEALFKEREGSEPPTSSFRGADSKLQTEAGNGRAWGSTRLNVHASLEKVAAFLWDFKR